MKEQFNGYEVIWWLDWYEANYPNEKFKLPGGCLPGDSIPVQRQAYRFIKTPAITQDDFKPAFFTNPKYRNSKRDSVKCKSMGLSMYDTLEAARESHHYYEEEYDRAWVESYLGTQIAHLTLTEEDGLAEPNVNAETGHYTFYPYLNREFPKRFNLVEAI